jgi:hypothetical protein
MAMGNVVQKISEGKKIKQAKSWRDEKVFIYFSPRGTQTFAGHSAPGDWVVAEARKPVTPGQEVTWQVVGGAHNLELNLPDVFEETRVVGKGGIASAAVRGDAAPGLHLYDAYVDGQLATGGSSPGIIIDP